MPFSTGDLFALVAGAAFFAVVADWRQVKAERGKAKAEEEAKQIESEAIKTVTGGQVIKL